MAKPGVISRLLYNIYKSTLGTLALLGAGNGT